ncbi:MAG: TolC family protein [Candidatus Krumholzibacteria bacterium]|nr:TolC family protein [Candidatus Krumholzibacteria bacterium]
MAFQSRAGRGPAALLAAATLALAGAAAAGTARVVSLREAIETAFEHSPNITYSRLRLEGSEARLRAQEAGLKTQLRLTLEPITYSNLDQFDDYFSTWYSSENTSSSGTFTIEQPLKWTDGTLSLNNGLTWQDSYSEAGDRESTTWQNRLYLQLQQPLFTYNRTRMELEELELDFENRRLQYAIDRLAIEQSVMTNFFGVYSQKMQVDINRDALETDREAYRIMQGKYEAGIGRQSDLSQAEVDMLSSEISYRNSRVSLAGALDAFKKLIGLPLDEEVDVDEDISFAPVGVDLEFAVRHGVENRMELRQQRIQIEQAYNAVVQASTTNEFRGDLVLRYGTTGTDEEFERIYDTPTQDQYVGVQFDIPLWDWGRRKNTIRASETSLESSRLQLEDQKNGIIIEIRDSYRRLENLEAQIALARKRVESAEQTYEVNLELYRGGSIDSRELGLSRQTLSSARMNELNALIDYKLQLLDLKIKTLWDFEKDRPALENDTQGV